MNAKLDKALAYLVETHSAEMCGHYGEPGYRDPEHLIILANWNNVPSGLAEWLERKCGCALEWSDEWDIDYNNDKAYRTSPDCYQWEPQTAVTDDGEMLTPDDDDATWIEEFSIWDKRQPIRCLPSRVTDMGDYELYQGELESGFHHDQTDDAQEIAKRAFDEGAERVVFRKVENSQFYIRFECWVVWPEADQ